VSYTRITEEALFKIMAEHVQKEVLNGIRERLMTAVSAEVEAVMREVAADLKTHVSCYRGFDGKTLPDEKGQSA
jgi:hypothetical protein